MIEPYYVSPDGAITIYQGDCLQIMPELEPGSIDAVVTDPPYLNLKGGYHYKSMTAVSRVAQATCTIGDPWGASTEWAIEAWRLVRYGVVCFTSFQGVVDTRLAFTEARSVALLTWYCHNAPPIAPNAPRYTTQFAWCLAKLPGLTWGGLDSTMLDVPMLQAGCFATERILGEGGRALHPTQKPVLLMKRILLAVVPVDMCILDPFLGSGTTLVACVQTGRRGIGIEINEAYCRIAKERVEKALMQHRLPLEVD